MRKFISLKTEIPGPKSQEIAKKREKYVLTPMGNSLSRAIFNMEKEL